MKQKLALLTLVAALSGAPVLAKAAGIDWKKVDAALGKTATVAGDVHRYGLPRSDLQVSLDGVAIKPGASSHAPGQPDTKSNLTTTGTGSGTQDSGIAGDVKVREQEQKPASETGTVSGTSNAHSSEAPGKSR
jgi:hypothetical protein